MDPAAVAAEFQLPGDVESAAPFRGGHINDSYVIATRAADTDESHARAPHRRRYLLQRINHSIFRDPAGLMDNILRVTTQIERVLHASGTAEVDRRVLRVVPARGGASSVRDVDGSWWRMYHFIENSRGRESADRPQDASSAGRAFGAFQRMLADWHAPRLNDTIPDFHNTPRRYAAFERAASADPAGRAAACREEIAVARRRRELAGVLLDLHARGAIPERIVHNDAKMSNVLFDAATGEALCVVDLDTVMPGLSLYDFGDMVRSMICPAAEDERDLARVEVRIDMFEGLARGYLGEADAFLTPAERAHLVAAGRLITYEQGLRFLADYLNGDTYYKTSRPGHNLDRARVQFALLASIERHEAELTAIASGLSR